MANIVKMPKMGNTVEECLLASWLVSQGDTINEGDILFTYETDKTEVEEKSEFSGTVLKLLVEEGDEVPVFDPIAIIGEEGEDISELLNEVNASSQSSTEEVEEQKEEVVQTSNEQVVNKDNIKISPRARKDAKEYGVNIDDVNVASGSNGRIISQDVKNSFYNPSVTETNNVEVKEENTSNSVNDTTNDASENYGTFDYSPIRKAIKKSMINSLEIAPHVSMSRSFDATSLFNLRKRIKDVNASGKAQIANSTINDFIVFVLARTAMKFPLVNSTTNGDTYTTYGHANVGVAVDNGQGLFVPVVKNADKMSVGEITKVTSGFVADIRNGKIDAKLFKDGTITISNVGNTGVEMFTPIINQPQSSILGVGAAVDRPKYDKDGNIVLFKSITLSLSFNHATYDGALAAKFLNQLAFDLENIDLLFMAG